MALGNTRRYHPYALQDALKNKINNIEEIKLLLVSSKEISSDILNDAVKYEGCKFEVIKLLVDNGAELDRWILCDAVRSKGCKVEIIRLLLEKGLKLYPSILQDAVLYGGCNFEVIKLLLENGAEIYPRILDDVINSKRFNFIALKLLLDHGANIDYVNLICVVESEICNFKILKLLLESGVELCEMTLCQAVKSRRCDIEAIKLLLDKSSEIPDSILDYAISSKRCDKIEVIKLLLKCGVKLPNEILEIVIQRFGCGEHNIELIKFLFKCGMKVNSDIFNCYKIYSFNSNASKVLLQYLVLQYMRTGFPLMNESLNHTTFFKLSNFENRFLYQEMCDFFFCLNEEFIKMTKDKIGHDSTLFSFILNQCSSVVRISLVNEILLRLHSKQYIYSRELLYATLSKNDVIDKLCQLNIFVEKKFCSEKVSLNADTISLLAFYLSKDDIINVIIAYWYKDEKKRLGGKFKRRNSIDENQNKLSFSLKRYKFS